jgi:enoyl-CoA hydratase/carnithine racemase
MKGQQFVAKEMYEADLVSEDDNNPNLRDATPKTARRIKKEEGLK